MKMEQVCDIISTELKRAGRLESKRAELNNQLKVFCRVRPLETAEPSCITVVSGTTVSISSSTSSQKTVGKELQCSFHKVFDESASQKTVFENVAFPLIDDIFKGKDSLLILCGNSGSGKTYTIIGNTKKDGIIPYSLDVIFSTITNLQTAKFIFKPDKMNGFEIQSELDAFKDRHNELRAYMKTARNPLPKVRKGPNMEIAEQNVNFPCSPIRDIDEDSVYAVFISFVVIYNNGVYDLLDIQDVGKLKHPQAKIVREDSSRNMYVHGVVEEEVKTSNEAFQIYLDGLQRKKIAAALLNSTCNRLHSVFTIRLVQSPLDYTGSTASGDKSALKISQLCFVDLARPEQVKSKKNAGKKLIESGHINNALTTLRLCLEVMRENQLLRNKKLVPFRGSKLTYLFKTYFEQGSKIYLLVCLNPAGDLEDIVNITKFADVKEISATEQKPSLKTENKQTKRTPFKVLNSEREKVVELWRNEKMQKYEESYSLNSTFPNLEMKSPTDDRLITNLVSFLESRKDVSDALRLTEKCKEESYQAHLKEVENRNVLLKQEHLRLQQTLNSVKFKENAVECRLRKTEAKAKELISRLECENSQYDLLEKELREVKLKQMQMELENRKLSKELNIKMTCEMNKSAENQRQKLQEQEARFKEQKKKMGKPLAKVKRVLLDEATSSTSDSSGGDTIQSDLMTNHNLVLQNDACAISDNRTTSQPSQMSVPQQQKVSASKSTPTSSAQDVWLEHRSGLIPAELGTVLQPHLKKSKKITKLPDAENVTNMKASKYCLMTQEADSSGGVETLLYKADVVPTAGGGAQVIYNDVEKLKQLSPLALPKRSQKATESTATTSKEERDTDDLP